MHRRADCKEWEYSTPLLADTSTSLANALYEPLPAGYIQLWPKQGYLNEVSVTCNNPPATGLIFSIQDRKANQDGSLPAQFTTLDVSPIIVPQLDANDNVASGVQFYWEPADLADAYCQQPRRKLRVGQFFRSGALLVVYAKNLDLNQWVVASNDLGFNLNIFAKASGLQLLPDE